MNCMKGWAEITLETKKMKMCVSRSQIMYSETYELKKRKRRNE